MPPSMVPTDRPPADVPTHPKYGHAPDFSWVAGILKFQPLEGGCWMLLFSEKPEDADAYYGRLALEVPDQLANELQDGRFVKITGQIVREEFSMACPPTIYEVETISPN